MQENYLAHYGIKGQKWGVRRFQNLDRSYTEEGKIRYGRKSEDGSALANDQKRGKATGGLTKGMASYNVAPIASAFVANEVAYRIKQRNARKEVEKAELNKDTERVTKDNIKRMAGHYTKKERQKIIQRMKDDPKMSFDKAEKPVSQEHDKRIMRNTLAFMAASIALPAAVAFAYEHREGISDKLHKFDNAVHRNKAYQSFMKSAKNAKVKNAVVLRSNEYEIDRKARLLAKRGT